MIRSFRPILFVIFVLGCGAASAAEPIGEVARVQNEAYASADDGDRLLLQGDPIYFGDRLLTGRDARLEVVFTDETRLTLGEYAAMDMDAFVYEPGNSSMSVNMLAGAFAFATGAIGKGNPEDVRVTTPVSTIGIRGTTFWGGPIDDAYGVLILDGAIEVTTRGGSVVLDEVGEGTAITSADAAPGAAVVWGENKTARAFATITFAE